MRGNSSLEGPRAAGGRFTRRTALFQQQLYGSRKYLLPIPCPASLLWAALGAMAAATAGRGPGCGPGDSPEGPEAEAPERRRKAHGMLKLYYGLSEVEAAGRPAGPDPLDPTDLNGAHFDPEVYLDKVCVSGGGTGPRYIAPHITPATLLRGGGWGEGRGVHKSRMTVGRAIGAELEDKGSWADLDWPEMVRSLRSPGLRF